MSDQPPCPNPHGMTEEFPEDIIETRAWRIKGVGIYGTDVDVIAIDEYRDLAHQQRTTMETLARWAESAKKHEERAEKAEAVARDLARAITEHRTAIHNAGSVRVVKDDIPVADAKHRADKRLWATLDPEPSEESGT